MADTTLVDVLDARHKLLENSDRCLLMQSLVLHYVVKKLSVHAVLHDEVQFCLRLNYLYTMHIQKNDQWSKFKSEFITNINDDNVLK